MTIFEETKYIMNKYDVHANKNLGQNFLVDEQALNLIAQEATADDTIIEIGPGLGTLTAILANKAKRVVVVELDPMMVEILQDRFKLYENVEIIHNDILKVNIEEIDENAKIIANLPYYITTQIITKLLKTCIKDITILIQKEVAERISALPGTKEAGAITYLVNYYTDATIIGDVPKQCFIPSPKVDSAVVNLKKLKEPRVKVENEEILFNLVKENFTKRRKTIINSLSNSINKNDLKLVLKEMDLDESVRGETLTLEQFAYIANYINNK